MSSEASPCQNDPLFGNAPTDLLREAAGTGGQPPTDPRFWEPPTPEELQARLDGYLIEAFLARGGMGAVYRGMQTALERPVAIKILPPSLGEHDHSFVLRFKQEARAMAQLNHPGIVKVYDFGEMSDGTLYFVMEYVEGTDVAKMVASQGRLSSAHAMAITAHVCDALQYAHQLGIIHRDIKPANIMVGTDGAVKVADFGLAKSFNSAHTTLTMTGHVMGTLHFMAPEALMLGSAVDHRADIYAVGVMLYQMLTGRLPQGMFEMPSLLVPGLDPRYDAIIVYAMRENRDHRYQTIYDMRYALDCIVTQPVVQLSALPQVTAPQQTAAAPARSAPRALAPGQPKPPQGAKQAPVMKKKPSAAIWLIAASVVLGLGGFVWMKMGKSEPLSELAPQPATPNPDGTIGDLGFPTAQFDNATISECVEYFQIKSRDLDPAKKGITFLVDEATRNSNASISFDLKEIRVADLIECFARVARLEVTHIGEAVQLKTSPSVKPPFPIGVPTKKLLQLGETIFPKVQFNKATLEEACEYLRVKPRDLSWGKHVNLIIDPDFTQRKHEITLDLTQVPLSDALAYITQMCNAEVTYMADAIYIQPRTPSVTPSPLKIGTPTPKLQKMGETIFPFMDFQKATIQEACEYVRIKGREISGQPVNLIIDPILAQQNHEISIWAPRVSLSAALSYIADLCDAEVGYLAETFYLQPRTTKLQNLDPWAVQSFGEAGKVIFPNVNFQNATIEEAAEFIRLKSRDLDPQKKGMVILLDEAACRAAGKITLDSQNITAANAIAQIAVTAGLEIFRVGDAARLRAPSKPKPSAAAPAKPITPSSSSITLRPSREDGEPSRIRFENKLSEEVRIQLVGSDGRLTTSFNLKAGKMSRKRSFIGQVWLVSKKSGSRLGIVESLTNDSSIKIEEAGLQVKANEVPERELVTLVQLTGASIGDAVTHLRARAAAAGLKTRIDLDPRVDPKAGSIHLDAGTVALDEVTDICAYHASLSTRKDGMNIRIVPR